MVLVNELTEKQIAHRQYLCSSLWKAKRKEAIEYYGNICNKCGEWGNDVHHKTYERTNGNELMQDLEILCRECHQAWHDLHDPSTVRRSKSVGRLVIYRYLSEFQREKLAKMFKITQAELIFKIKTDNFIAYRSANLLGYKKIHEGYNRYTNLGQGLRTYSISSKTSGPRNQTGLRRSSMKMSGPCRSGC
jgi:hypothetical protein